MPPEIPLDCRLAAEAQDGVISRRKAIEAGLAASTPAWLARDGRWLRIHRGVYSIYTGDPPWDARLWAAICRAGPGAALSHQTAAELDGLADRPGPTIHVTIPVQRRIAPIRGVVIHRSNRIDEAVHPVRRPPRTRIEETVLDLVDQSPSFSAAFGWVCAAIQRRLTTPDRIVEFMERRKRLRWRRPLARALADIGGGVHSWLEYRYVHGVERAHGLPVATRQRKVLLGSRSGYLDNLYECYSLCVETDGRAAHPVDRRWADTQRDNALAVTGITTMRYGWDDIASRPCQVAGEIAAALAQRGWAGRIRRCGPDCAATRLR
ncbi:MAG: type IV toxin-antitoxin system AbiEi family antitoxin domain-containing protein [Actinomycetota bacterium]|nr:type IV toxin-antitoxin system AbiEi family antitoxin domain-containing protein [Actinomycetota bacterium]